MPKTKDSVITTMLLSLGIRSNLKGYIYLKAAIFIIAFVNKKLSHLANKKVSQL